MRCCRDRVISAIQIAHGHVKARNHRQMRGVKQRFLEDIMQHPHYTRVQATWAANAIGTFAEYIIADLSQRRHIRKARRSFAHPYSQGAHAAFKGHIRPGAGLRREMNIAGQ